MCDKLTYLMQVATIEQLELELKNKMPIDKKLVDFNNGRKIIDSLFELNNEILDDNVKEALLIYGIYKLRKR